MVNSNDIIRRLRYTFGFSDSDMIDIFGLAGHKVTRSQISNWLKKDDDPAFQDLDDYQLAVFLNGFIIHKRGMKEGKPAAAEKRLNNNIVLRKLKIALNLKDEGILEILGQVERNISKHELSAFFRKPDQPQYRPCQDQILRNFLHGMQLKFHPNSTHPQPLSAS
jgi:uncharacterized protein YehS (DUF1456 family)